MVVCVLFLASNREEANLILEQIQLFSLVTLLDKRHTRLIILSQTKFSYQEMSLSMRSNSHITLKVIFLLFFPQFIFLLKLPLTHSIPLLFNLLNNLLQHQKNLLQLIPQLHMFIIMILKFLIFSKTLTLLTLENLLGYTNLQNIIKIILAAHLKVIGVTLLSHLYFQQINNNILPFT